MSRPDADDPGQQLVRVFVVDDHAVVRRGLRAYLEVVDAMEVVGKFTSQPAGAKVTLVVDGDKKVVGVTPVDFKLDPRKRYEAVFKKDGFVPVSRAIAMTGGQEVPVEVSLEKGSGPVRKIAVAEETATAPDLSLISGGTRKAGEGGKKSEPVKKAEPAKKEPAAAEPKDEAGSDDATADEDGFGMLGLGAKPPCRIFIDGRDTGQKTPQVGIKLKAGKHRVTLVNNDWGGSGLARKLKPQRRFRLMAKAGGRRWRRPAPTGR